MTKATTVCMVLVVLLVGTFAMADNPQLLTNPNFSSGSTGSVSGPHGNTPATGWDYWSNIAGTTVTTQLAPSTLGSGNMLNVSTNNAWSGIYQFFPDITPGNGIISSIWVNVTSGTVGLGIGANGNVSFVASTSANGWMQLSFSGIGPMYNEIVLYALSDGGAQFSAANASVVDPVSTPEPGSLLMLASGIIAVGFRRIRK
jgi:hypothetical protein